MLKNFRVAVFATHIAPALGYGGVSVTAAVLTRAWGQCGHRIVLCASDESVGGALRPEDVRLGDNVDVCLYHCYWFRRWGFGLGAIPMILSICRQTQVAYIHGIATWPSTLAAVFCSLLRRHFVVAPRGGLMPEHVALIRRKKPHKWLYYKLLTLPTLRQAAAIHCTSETESDGVKRLLGQDAKTVIIPNGVDSQSFKVKAPPSQANAIMCFLGHVQAEKGINAFIRIWLTQRRVGDQLMVAGRGVDGTYFKTFQLLVQASHGAVIYRGYLDRQGVDEVLAVSHFLVLPSGLEPTGGMRENFGNAVAEALAAGRPALVAKGLAWDGLESAGAGFVFDRSTASVCEVLRRAQSLNDEHWATMSHKARRYVEENFDAHRLAQRLWNALMVANDPRQLSPSD